MGGLSAIRFDVWEVLLLFGILQAVFLAIVILWSHRRKHSEYYLVFLLAILTLNLLNFLLLKASLFHLVPHLVHISLPPLLLLGPVYYFYARSIVWEQNMSWSDVWHFALFGLGIIYFMPFYLLPPAQKLTVIGSLQVSATMPVTLSMVAFLLVQILQSIYYTLRVHRLITLSGESSTPVMHLDRVRWLRSFNLGFALFWFTDLLCLVWFAMTGMMRYESFYIVMLLCAVFISVLAFFGMRWNKHFSQVILNQRSKSYRTVPLSQDQSNQLVQRLQSIMEEKDLYLDPQLSLEQLAAQIRVPKHHLSHVLNVTMGKSFYEFINEYRFTEVKRRLAQEDLKHLTILAIALESGFNNKNTFNKVFKKYAGMTPSHYVKNLASTEE